MADSLRGLLYLAFDLGHIHNGIRVVKPGTDQVFTISRQLSKSWMTDPIATYTDGKGNPVVVRALLDDGTPGVLAGRGVSYDDDGWLIPTDDLYAAAHNVLSLFVNGMNQYGAKNDPHRVFADAVLAAHAALGTLEYVDVEDLEAHSEDETNEETGKDGTDAE